MAEIDVLVSLVRDTLTGCVYGQHVSVLGDGSGADRGLGPVLEPVMTVSGPIDLETLHFRFRVDVPAERLPGESEADWAERVGGGS